MGWATFWAIIYQTHLLVTLLCIQEWEECRKGDSCDLHLAMQIRN
jgi:hypothetical protein